MATHERGGGRVAYHAPADDRNRGGGGLARGGDPTRAGELVAGLFGPRASRTLSATQKAARAWYAANGDRERAHTTGVWLRKSGRTGVDPVMTVAVDAHWLAGELGTNKDLYLQRLANLGVRVSDIRFTVRPAADKTRRLRGREGEKPAPAPPLSDEERQRVEQECSGLPQGLRESVARAMGASLRRGKRRRTADGD